MADRLTRRERAALALTLDVLRRGPEPDAPCGCHGGMLHTEAGLDACTRCDGYGGIPDPLIRHMQWAADILLAEDGGDATVHAWEAVVHSEARGNERIVRARLALWIRARLRADAGDCGPTACTGCRREADRGEWAGLSCDWCGPLSESHLDWRRITPLWQSAPETRR